MVGKLSRVPVPFMKVEAGLFYRPALTVGAAPTAGDVRKRSNDVVAIDIPLSKGPGPRDEGIWSPGQGRRKFHKYGLGMLSVKRHTPICPCLEGNLVEGTIICAILKNNGTDITFFKGATASYWSRP